MSPKLIREAFRETFGFPLDYVTDDDIMKLQKRAVNLFDLLDDLHSVYYNEYEETDDEDDEDFGYVSNLFW